MPSDDGAAGGGAGDVSDMRASGPGGVGRSANSAMRQMIDCHVSSVAWRPPRCKGGRTYGFCAKTRAEGQSDLQGFRLKIMGFELTTHVHMHMLKPPDGGSILSPCQPFRGAAGKGSEGDFEG